MEFKTAYEEATKLQCDIILCDRPVNTTLTRLWGFLPLWSKCKVIVSIIYLLFYNISEKEVEELKNSNMEELILEFSKEFPELSEVLINERDMYMSRVILKYIEQIKKENERKKMEELKKLQEKENQEDEELEEGMENSSPEKTKEITVKNENDEKKDEINDEISEEVLVEEIKENPKESILVVIGMGHVKGIKNYIENPNSIGKFKDLPKPSNIPKYLKWVLIGFVFYFLIKWIWSFFK